MRLTSGAGRRGSRGWLVPGAAFIAASVVALAGCGSSGSSSASGSSSSASGSATPAGVTKANQEVASLSATTSSYPVPTASVSGVSKFKGRTVYYTPASW
jgi:ribose transport system substrate-binding protein